MAKSCDYCVIIAFIPAINLCSWTLICCNFGLLYLTQSLMKVTPNNFSLLFLFRKVSSKYSKNYMSLQGVSGATQTRLISNYNWQLECLSLLSAFWLVIILQSSFCVCISIESQLHVDTFVLVMSTCPCLHVHGSKLIYYAACLHSFFVLWEFAPLWQAFRKDALAW